MSTHPGFRSLQSEIDNEELTFQGTVPAWLEGTLIRNGPGLFDIDGTRVSHWFDGLAMLRRYKFIDGNISYSNRFLRTDAHADAAEGRLTGQFGTDTRGWRRLIEPLRSGLPTPTDNANVHVAQIDQEYVALTEAPRRVSFDLDTLQTQDEFEFADDLTEHLTAAHLVDDQRQRELVGFATQFGRVPKYHVYRIPYGSRTRERLTSVEARGPAYMHDCSVTDEHIVLVEVPLIISVLQALNPFTEGIQDLFSWEPERGMRLLVIRRDTGELVADPVVDSAFVFHHINAYLDNNTVVLDLVEYADNRVLDAMQMQQLDTITSNPAPDGTPVRYRINTTDESVERVSLGEVGMELPRIAQADVSGRHRYTYAQLTHRDGGNGLVKLDCDTGETREWWEAGVYLEEPVPIRHPEATEDDDGVVIAPALDTEQDQTDLLLFDASTLDIQARAPLPHSEPFGFHGRFFST
ncbi:MAG: lignostilbene-alpha,beta-dioxygenase related enzyme [Haloquadratum sp. J07HQX50]|jgi:Lignostilbene-alpha,beta-dioxygenase and related enzymes|nr:MAG: lignostilbene-alpha,beta-dioxygenase related enzyme [Haloquadratum sp. J07HQX50]